MRSTNRQPPSLWQPKAFFRHNTPRRSSRSAWLFVGSTPSVTTNRHKAGATIDSSLYLAGMQAGIPADIVIDLIRMFSYKVDFQRDLHPGDRFEVYYDYYYTPEGQPGTILVVLLSR